MSTFQLKYTICNKIIKNNFIDHTLMNNENTSVSDKIMSYMAGQTQIKMLRIVAIELKRTIFGSHISYNR